MASSFTAHNIRLDDGSLTKPEQPWQMEDLVLVKLTKQFLRILFPDGVAGKRVVDLGCLEGGYTVELQRVVIIDTHVADTQPNGKFALSKITENEGWAGRWFSQFDDDKTRHTDKWSSWSNQKSFWPMKRDLMQGLLQAGFTMVLESPTFESYLELTHRVTIIGVKH